MVPEREMICPSPLPLCVFSMFLVTSQGLAFCITVLLSHLNRIQNIIKNNKGESITFFILNRLTGLKITLEARA